jgi:hypothetical protein
MNDQSNESWRDQERTSNRFRPWHRADGLTDCSLYWLPATSFPLRSVEKAWICRLILELKQSAAAQLELRMEYFLEKKVLYPLLMDPFLRHAMEFNPVGGTCIRWNRPLPRPLTPEDVQRIIDSGEPFDPDKYTNDTLFWFARRKHDIQLQQFFGFGGSMALWIPPDPDLPKMPILFPKKVLEDPRFKPLDFPGTAEVTMSLADKFLPASKELFAKEYSQELHLLGTPFFLPAFNAQDILTARGEQRQEWLKFMPIYLAESPVDKGILIFATKELDGLLLDILKKLDEEKLIYPGYEREQA